MSRQTLRNLLIGLTFLFIPQASSWAAECPANGNAPLSWQTTGTQPAFVDSVRAKACVAIGLDRTCRISGPPTYMQITDRATEIGIAKKVFYGWLVPIDDVPVQNKATTEKASVDLKVLIDDRNRTLVATFTACNETRWVDRHLSMSPRDPVKEMANDGWNVSPPDAAEPYSKAGDVLSSLWTNTGISPLDAGQIVLMPRNAAPSLPAKQVGRGKPAPLFRSGIYWVAYVTGTLTYTMHPPVDPTASAPQGKDIPYMSGLIALFSDIGQQSIRGIYLP